MGVFTQRGVGGLLVVGGLLLAAASACGLEGTEIHEIPELPQVVFEGGGGTLEIDVELNRPAELKASFERWLGPEESELLSSSQSLEPGSHHFEVDVPDATYGYFEVGVPDAEVGARIAWTVSLDGAPLERQEVELERPLEPGYAFFVQFEFDEVSELRQYAQR